MYKKICKYLKDHNLEFGGFDLSDNGLSVCISRWDYNINQPTLEELNAIPEGDAEAIFYVENRRSSYPSIGDQLDALWKSGAEADAMKEQITQVKLAYPKPE